MRTRVTPIALLGLALALGAPAAADAARPASVRVSKCKTGAAPSQRSATYQAWMEAVPGSVRMGVRFKLFAHYAGHRSAEPLANSKLSVWHRSHKGVTRFGYAQTVKELHAGASYRTLVKFRWYDAKGHVIKRAHRVSAACVQDGKLPNLIVSAVKISPGTSPKTAVYSVSIGNTGAGSASNFSLTLIVDGAIADSRQIGELDAGESATINLNGPTCHRLRAVVDREQAVPETNEDDNSFGERC
jgi:CARDB